MGNNNEAKGPSLFIIVVMMAVGFVIVALLSKVAHAEEELKYSAYDAAVTLSKLQIKADQAEDVLRLKKLLSKLYTGTESQAAQLKELRAQVVKCEAGKDADLTKTE